MGKKKKNGNKDMEGLSPNLFIQAYNTLVSDGIDHDDILSNLSEWICRLLDDDNDKVVYFTLPIWTYLENKWDPECPLRISKVNDRFLSADKGCRRWYGRYVNDSRLTQFSEFRDNSELINRGFSFVEFVTQNANNLSPVFVIKYEDDAKNRGVRFELLGKSILKLINNLAKNSRDEKYKTT